MRGPLVWISLISLCASIQLVLLVGWIVQIASGGAVKLSDVMYYGIFLAGALACGLYLPRRLALRWSDDAFSTRLIIYTVIDGILTALLLSALFQMVIYDQWSQLARSAYTIVLILTLAYKFTFKHVISFLLSFVGFITDVKNQRVLSWVALYGFMALIAVIIFMPDPEGVIARIFLGEQFHHWDVSITGPAYAYLTGLKLNVDVISKYGLGMPIVLAFLTKALGGFSYVHLLQVLMVISIAYYIAWFLLMRRWLGSTLIAMAAILFAMRTQMFHIGAYPNPFTYASGTPLRFFIDIVVFWFLYQHIRTRKTFYLWLSSVACGFMLFYMFAEGLYITAAFYAYIGLHLITPHARHILYRKSGDAWRIIGYVIGAPIMFAALMFLTQGLSMFDPVFWSNTAEFRNYFLSGYPVAPMTGSLKDGQFLQSLMGFVMPFVYVGTVISIVTLWYLKKIRHDYILAAIIALQGLGLYHYYVVLSIWTGYYMLGFCFNMLIAFWVHLYLKRFPEVPRKLIALGIVVFCTYALMTTHNYVSYPNALNLSKNPLIDTKVVQFPPGRFSYFNHLFIQYPDAFKLKLNSLGQVDEDLHIEREFNSDEDVKAYYRSEIDFRDDAALINKFSKPDDRIPLLSCFEIEILMQAGFRKPFFYTFPLFNSRPMKMRIFHITHLNTTGELKRLIDQLETQQPPYIFMERIYLTKEVPQSYYYDTPGLMAILEYVHQKYTPTEVGKYLVAMKRK